MKVQDTATPNGDATASNEAEQTQTTEGQTSETQSSAERLLSESKKYKARMLAAEKELAEIKKKSLESQGAYKEMYESLQKEHNSLKGSLVKERISQSVKTIAEKLGCQNADAVLKLGNPELLQYDEESHQVFGAEQFVEDVKKQIPALFTSKSTPTINPTTPGGVVRDKELSAKDVMKLPLAERHKLMASMMSGKR